MHELLVKLLQPSLVVRMSGVNDNHDFSSSGDSILQNNPEKRCATGTVARVARCTDSSSGADSSTLQSRDQALCNHTVADSMNVTDSLFLVVIDSVVGVLDQQCNWCTPLRRELGPFWNATPGAPVAEAKPQGKVRRLQQPGQSADDYQTELVKLLSGRLDAEDSEVALEQLIYGLYQPKIQKHVGKRMSVDLHDALRIAREYEETSSWVASASRFAHKRIGMVTVAETDRPATLHMDKGSQQPAGERSLVGDMDEWFKKVEAWTLHNQQFCKTRENGNGKGKVSDTSKGEDKENATPSVGNDGGKQQD